MRSKQSDPGGDRYHRREERKKMHKEQMPGTDDQPLPPPTEPIRSDAQPKRNDPCLCGSGKKYKQCCGKAGR